MELTHLGSDLNKLNAIKIKIKQGYMTMFSLQSIDSRDFEEKAGCNKI